MFFVQSVSSFFFSPSVPIILSSFFSFSIIISEQSGGTSILFVDSVDSFFFPFEISVIKIFMGTDILIFPSMLVNDLSLILLDVLAIPGSD